jgi:signal peptidase I
VSAGPNDPPQDYEVTEVAVLPPQAKKKRWGLRIFLIVAICLFNPFALLLTLRIFVEQTFYIPSGSMEPTLKVGDRIAVSKISYDFQNVETGDIVVFSRPPAEDCGGPSANDLVKRVIGLPGQTVSLQHAHVYIDGRQLKEPWLPTSEQGTTYPGPVGTPYNLAKPYVVPKNDYYVMGDNRLGSCDSRYWGPIRQSSIVGKVVVRVWPISSIHIF